MAYSPGSGAAKGRLLVKVRKDLPLTELITLTEQDRGRIAAHLLALEPESRWRRFLAGVADSSIQTYVDGLGAPRDILIGAVEGAKEAKEVEGAAEPGDVPALIGLAHAALWPEDGVLTAEIGLSVLAAAREAGIGRQLLRQAMVEAGRRGARRAVLQFSADNRAMRALLKSTAGALFTGASVRQAAFNLPMSLPPPPARVTHADAGLKCWPHAARSLCACRPRHSRARAA